MPVVIRNIFEEYCTEQFDVQDTIAVNNGTSALIAPLWSMDLQPGDEVITTPFTFIGTTNAILMAAGGNGNYQVDEKITQASTGANGTVVEWDSTNRILYYVQEKYSSYGLDSSGNLTAFSGANAVTGSSSGAAFTPSTGTSGTTNGVVFASGYAVPELSRDTGEIIYVENRRAISRASDQTEDIKVVVEF